jgi:catechol 2,3-dioxygenase-like lactoylglutathione lyase family enzyme
MLLPDQLILGVDVVFLHTSDPSLRYFYRDILGLALGYEDGHWHEFVMVEGSRFGLDFTDDLRSEIENQAVMVSFKVADIHHAVEAFRQRGVRFAETSEGFIFDVGPTLVATFQDPDGNWMQLSQRKKS